MNAPAKTILIIAPLLLASCNGSCQNQQITTNVMPLQVADMFSSSTSTAANMLYTTVTICDANSNCQAINDIQVDTGSGGLRIFKGALTVGLTQIPSGQGSLGECQTFGGMTTWGSVQTATVKLASEPAITIPVQVIDPTFGQMPGPSPCDIGNWNSPMDLHANGILGIDVGAPDSGVYFTCHVTSCTELMQSDVTASQRVTNPVLALPTDNQGVIINLPNVPDNGQPTASGELVLGIGASTPGNPQSNDPANYSANPVVTVSLNPNDPLSASTTAHFPDMTGQVPPTTTHDVTFDMFAADTGSNAFRFTDPRIPRCPSPLNSVVTSGWYCPVPPQNFAVSVTGSATGNNLPPVWHFQGWIRDKTALRPTVNLALNDLGFNPGMDANDLFIAGLPFFYGKQVYFLYTTKSNPTLGSGPLYGYALR